ncbi:MAG: acetate--CoA ligase [Planctomycetota bacterium]
MPDADATESMLQESRRFPPPTGFAEQAHIGSMAHYEALHKYSVEQPEAFWSAVASDLHWFEPWDKVLEYEAPDAKWFVGGKTNLCYNCLDRQVEAGLGNATAIIWEGEPVAPGSGEPEVRQLTYADLLRDVSRFANVLKAKGVKKGDVVTIYMGMVPELAVATLACARIGAVHSIIFGGFSAQAIRDRVEDGRSKILVTCDGSWRRGKAVPLKANVDEALTMTDLIDDVIVLRRCGNEVAMTPGRDHWWHDLADAEGIADTCPAEPMDSEDLLFILYTSGSTGKPKGIMHTTGGYMVHTYLTAKLTFDLHGHAADDQPDRPAWLDVEGFNPPEPVVETTPPDVYWCTADLGWITGHSYIVYGLLPNRVPTLMYEGAPNFPGNDRFWDVIERHRVTKFYTAPTAIRAFMKWGNQHVEKHDLSSLKVLGTVGEPINPEAWVWYHEVIGGGRCPIVDTWWQTETGGHMLTPLPGATTTTPGSCCRPMLGIDAAVVNSDGEEVPNNTGGILVVRKPWPSMLRGIYGDRQRFLDTYWSKVPGMYCPADGARIDPDGNFWITGRIDDVIVVAGHNLGTMEVESALVSHEAVAEAAVVGFPHDVKGTGIAAFVITRGNVPAPGSDSAEALKKSIRDHVAHELGPISKPDQVRLTDALPKTRSGKIMRRLLRDIAAGNEIKQDTTTLEDRGIVEKLISSA